MAEKEATMFVIDLGASMGKKHGGRNETDLDWVMKYVWDKIATMVHSPCMLERLLDSGGSGCDRSKDDKWRCCRLPNRW